MQAVNRRTILRSLGIAGIALVMSGCASVNVVNTTGISVGTSVALPDRDGNQTVWLKAGETRSFLVTDEGPFTVTALIWNSEGGTARFALSEGVKRQLANWQNLSTEQIIELQKLLLIYDKELEGNTVACSAPLALFGDGIATIAPGKDGITISCASIKPKEE